MRDFLRPALKILVTFLIAAAVINEIGSILWAQYNSDEVAKTIAEGSRSQYIASHSQGAAAQTAVDMGVQHGVTVYGFQIQNQSLTVWIKAPPRRTPLVTSLEWMGTQFDIAKGWSASLNNSLTVDTKYTTDIPLT